MIRMARVLRCQLCSCQGGNAPLQGHPGGTLWTAKVPAVRLEKGIPIGVPTLGTRVGDGAGLLSRRWGTVGVETGDPLRGVIAGVLASDPWQGVGGYSSG